MSIGAIGLLLWFIARVLRRGERSTSSATTQGDTVGPILAILIWVIVGSLMLVWAIELRSGKLEVLPNLLCGLVVLFPWPLLRLVVMPLGLVRTAYYASYLCVLRFGNDRSGGALLVGAWARLQAPAGRREGGARFLEKKLSRLKKPRGAAVVATALGAASRGDLELARTTMQCIDNLDPAACPRWASRLAREWLSVDAIADGDWHKVRALTAGFGPYSPLTRFLGSCAECFVPAPVDAGPLPGAAKDAAGAAAVDVVRPLRPSNAALWWRWLRAPYHQATLPLLKRAQNSTPQRPNHTLAKTSTTAPLSDQPPELSAALRELVALLDVPGPDLTEEQLVQVCRSWDAALANPQTRRQLAERALSLGVGTPDAALRELRAQVAEVIGTRLRESGLPIGQLLGDGLAGAAATPLGATAAHGVRTQLLEEIEQACDALHDRTTDKRALPILDEWREWAVLLGRYHRVCKLGGLAVRRLAWAPLHRQACNWAVWLWNERSEKVLANAVFRFLLSEAEHLQDDSRIALDQKNVDAGI